MTQDTNLVDPILIANIKKISLEEEVGIYMIGALPTGRGCHKNVVVAIDYFTKKVELEELNKITEPRNIKLRDIISSSASEEIVTDHGSQFDNEAFGNFRDKFLLTK